VRGQEQAHNEAGYQDSADDQSLEQIQDGAISMGDDSPILAETAGTRKGATSGEWRPGPVCVTTQWSKLEWDNIWLFTFMQVYIPE
jgi:hypothetical protein